MEATPARQMLPLSLNNDRSTHAEIPDRADLPGAASRCRPLEGGAKALVGIIDNNAAAGVTWVHSYVSADRQRTYCIYDAPDPEADPHRRRRQQPPGRRDQGGPGARPLLLRGVARLSLEAARRGPPEDRGQNERVIVAAEFGTGQVFWSLLWLTLWVIWLWLLFIVFRAIIFRSDDPGWAKALWVLFVLVLPVPRRVRLLDRAGTAPVDPSPPYPWIGGPPLQLAT